MPGANAARDLLFANVCTEDPGSDGIIVQISEFQIVELKTGASAENRTLQAPDYPGKTIRIVLVEDGGGDLTISVAEAIDVVGNTSFTLNDAGDSITLFSIRSGNNFKWVRESHNGVSFPLGDGAAGGALNDGDKGDVIVSSSGSTWTIDTGVVTFAKMQQIDTETFLGRVTAGTGAVESLTVSDVRTLLNVADGADVTDATSVDAAGAVMVADNDASSFGFVSNDTTLAGDSATELVTEHAAKTYIDTAIAGIETGGTLIDGDKGDITVSSSGAVWTIDNGAVTLAKMANISQTDILGRGSSGTGPPEALNPVVIRSILNVANGADVTESTNVALAGAVMTSQTSVSGAGFVLDEDDMASDSASKLPTQSSVKTYTDSNIVTYASHGLVSGDVGKPLSGSAILDDADATHYPSTVLLEVVNSNTLRVASPGRLVTLAVALLSGGSGYSIATSGRYVYWDKSAGTYSGTLPSDGMSPAVLELLSVGASTFVARVRCY